MAKKLKNGKARETHQDTEAEEGHQAEEVAPEVSKSDYEIESDRLQLKLSNIIALFDVLIVLQKKDGKSYQRFVQARYDLQRMQKHLK